VRSLQLSIAILCLTAPLARAAPALDDLLILYPVIRFESGLDGAGTMALSKLGRIVTADKRLAESAAALQIPMTGIPESGKVSRETLAKLIRQTRVLAHFKVLGPEAIVIKSVASTAAVERLLLEAGDFLELYVASNWPQRYRNMSYRFVGHKNRIELDANSRWSFQTDALTVLERRTPLWVEVEEDGEKHRMSLWFAVTGEVSVWRAAIDLEPQTAVTHQWFYRDWASLQEVNPAQLAAPTSELRLVSGLQGAAVLTSSVLEPIPAVEFGEQAQVIAQNGSIRIVTSATVMRSAMIGQRVTLKSHSSNEEFEALVIAPKLVEMTSPTAVTEAWR